MQTNKNNIKRIGIKIEKSNNLTRIVFIQRICALQGNGIAIKNIRTLTLLIGNVGKPWGTGSHTIAYSENGEIPNYFSLIRNTNSFHCRQSVFPLKPSKGNKMLRRIWIFWVVILCSWWKSSEMSVDLYWTTWHYNPGDCALNANPIKHQLVICNKVL